MKLLNNKLFRRVLVTDTLSILGDGIFYICLLNYAKSLAFDKTAIVLVGIAVSLPNFLSFITGAMADRIAKKIKWLINLFVVRALLYLVVTWLFSLDAHSVGLFVLLVSLVSLATFFGNLSDSLYTPLFPKIVSQDQVEQASGLSYAVAQVAQTSSNFVAGICLLYFQPLQISLMTATTYLVITGVFIISRQSFQSIERQLETYETHTRLRVILQETLTFVTRSSELGRAIYKFSLINLVNTPLITLFAIHLAGSNYSQVNSEGLLALFLGLFSLGGLLGSLIAPISMKRFKLHTLASMNLIVLALLILSLTVGQVGMVMVFQAANGFLAGAIIPKFSALVIEQVPEKQLATISSGLNTYLLGLGLMATTSLGGLATFVPVNTLYMCLLALMGLGGLLVKLSQK